MKRPDEVRLSESLFGQGDPDALRFDPMAVDRLVRSGNAFYGLNGLKGQLAAKPESGSDETFSDGVQKPQTLPGTRMSSKYILPKISPYSGLIEKQRALSEERLTGKSTLPKIGRYSELNEKQNVLDELWSKKIILGSADSRVLKKGKRFLASKRFTARRLIAGPGDTD